jgi:T5orf172 domain
LKLCNWQFVKGRQHRAKVEGHMAASTLNKINGSFYLKITPGRAQIIAQALEIALASGKLDKRIKGTVSKHRALFASAASGKSVEENPAGWVYVLRDGPRGKKLTKIGHTRNIAQRLSRKTDRTTDIVFVAAWKFGSVREAMAREKAARRMFKPHLGGGGTEWVEAKAEEVLAKLTAKWKAPDALG